MTSITRIDYIVHPIYPLDVKREETLDLVSRLTRFTSFVGQEYSRACILLHSGHEHFKAYKLARQSPPGTQRLNHLVLEYYKLAHQLTKNLIENCRYLSIGEATRFTPQSNKTHLSEDFKYFLEENDFDLDNPLIIGHGTRKSRCVRSFCRELINCLENEMNIKTTFQFNDKTCLDLK